MEPAKPNTAPGKVLARIRQALVKAKDVLAVVEIASVDNKPALVDQEQEVIKDLQKATQGLKTATQKRLQPQKAELENARKSAKERNRNSGRDINNRRDRGSHTKVKDTQSTGPDEEEALQRTSTNLKKAMGEITKTMGETKKAMDKPTRLPSNVKNTIVKASIAVKSASAEADDEGEMLC